MSTASAEHPDAQGFDVVHAKLLRFLPELVGELGGDPAALLAQVGIDPGELACGEARPTYRQITQLLETAATTLDCPDFGMRLALRQSDDRICDDRLYGPLGPVMRHSRTFGEALEYVSTHIQAHSLGAAIRLKRLPAERATFVQHEILAEGIQSRRQVVEQILLVGHYGTMEITGGHARVRRVHFRHEPVAPLKTYRRNFRCEVRFGQDEDGVVHSDRDWACPIIDSDVESYRAATDFVERGFTHDRPPLHARARALVMRWIGTDRCSNDHVAAELNLHPRTLHRRLGGEDTSFQKIKDEVRCDLMLYYLRETRLEFARISEMLGFAEQSVMTRQCNRWFAASPTRIRAEGTPLHFVEIGQVAA